MDEGILSIECLAALGLAKQPFQPQPQGPFVYSDPALDMALNVVAQHLRERAQPVLVRGESGVGKTTLLRRLPERLGDAAHLCPIETGPDISMAAVDYCIRLQWQPRPEHGDPRKLSVEQYLFALFEGGVRPVLVVDDAHRLTAEVLAGLFALKHRMFRDYGQRLGLLLSAEPGIEPVLSEIAGRSPAVAELYTVVLRPFNRDQTRAYIEHRLCAAGAPRPRILDEAALARIQQESGGVPARIHAAARRELEARCGIDAATQATRPWYARAAVPAAFGVSVLGLAVALYGLLGGWGRGGPATAAQPSPPAEVMQAPAERPQARPGPGVEPPSAPRASPTPAPPATPQAPLAEAGDGPGTAPGQPEPEETTPGEESRATPAGPPAPPQAPTVAGGRLHDRLWLLQQDPDTYTVQVLGVSSEAALRSYYDRYRFSGDSGYFNAPRDGRDWFVLVTGLYPSAEAAREAIRALPEEVRANHPWVRRLGDVQLAILTAEDLPAAPRGP